MAITNINISDELQTGAPSIKYSGDMRPTQTASASDPMDEKNQISLQLFGKPLHQLNPDEEMMLDDWLEDKAQKWGGAYGGIAGLGGRRRYGLGSSLKKRIRKLIPNELATVASAAAPFVAPFNPIAGGLMAGVGGFDRTGSIGKSLKSGLMTYGMGQVARGVGGGMENLQTGWNPLNTSSMQGMGSGLTKYFSNPMQSSGGLGKWLDQRGSNVVDKVTDKISVLDEPTLQGDYTKAGKKIIESGLKKGTSGTMKVINALTDSTAKKIILGAMAGTGLYTAYTQGRAKIEDLAEVARGEGLDIAGIRKEVQDALAGGEAAWNELKKKYPYIGEYDTKLKAEGGRIGLYAGGQSIPSEYTMEDARKTAMQDRLGGITDVMKQADLFRQGDVGQMYMADGGLMDMGGMEKDYRQEGGFVPIGGKEKADDVPARLSKNEFVFTADAVRAAGGGDIDQGAGIMEKVMKNLEKGGRISEESQGLKGARDMFQVSERLSEVV